MADGHSAIKPPKNSSEFYNLVTELRKHHELMATQWQEVAAVLKVALPNAKGKNLPGWMRPDLKIAAWMVCRKLAHVSACNIATAKALTATYITYNDQFVNRRSTASPAAFDIDK
jgi:hypothetical protein